MRPIFDDIDRVLNEFISTTRTNTQSFKDLQQKADNKKLNNIDITNELHSDFKKINNDNNHSNLATSTPPF